MDGSVLFIFTLVQEVFMTVLECSSFKSRVSVMPHAPSVTSLPFLGGSPVLVNWSLISPDSLCMDPPRKPRFYRRALGEVSAIFACDECPKCSVVLPDAYEVPLGTRINSIFILGQWVPHNRARSDIPVFYLETPKKMTNPLRNCRLVLADQSRFDGTLVGTLAAPAILLFFVFFLLVLLRYCCCRPPRKAENYGSSYGWE